MLIDFRELFPKYNVNPKGVLHVGGNRGEEYPVYMELGITKQIWYEPNPEMFSLLQETIKNNPEAIAFQLCVGHENKEVVLHISNNAGQSSSIMELGTHAEVHPEVHYIKDIAVPMVRLDSQFQSYNSDIDFLNADVQGNELNVLKGLGELLHNFKYLYLEVNWKELYIGCALFDEVVEYVSKFGFKIAEYKECGNTSWGDCFFIRK